MIDWLRRAQADPTVEVGGRLLPIVLRRHPTARRFVMRLAPDGSEVRVTMPRWGRTADAIGFVESRTQWLANQLSAVPERQAPTVGGTLRYRGQLLVIAWQEDAPRRPRREDDRILLGGPQAALPGRLRRWMECEALPLMEADLAEYCEGAGVPVPALRLSRAQRRWGSCASDGTVRINWRLVQAPDFVRRSVVAHEVAHLVHFDHSPAFHALLERIFEGDVAKANAWLKREGRTLYAAFG